MSSETPDAVADMLAVAAQPEEPPAPKALTFGEVLLGPPHGPSCSAELLHVPNSGIYLPHLPELKLHCSGECDGTMNHDGKWAHPMSAKTFAAPSRDLTDIFAALQVSAHHQTAIYRCRHCKKHSVSMSLRITPPPQKGFAKGEQAEVRKVGQDPDFQPRIPKRLQRFISDSSDDWKLFQKGWRCEHRGDGIGAHAYYRRVVDHVWAKLLGKLIEVAKATNDQDSEQRLRRAQGQRQFDQAMADVGDAVPKRLFIGSANPIRLLYKAFSGGVHNLSDEECLGDAVDGRTILQNLLENIDDVLKDRKELNRSVARLQQRSSQTAPPALPKQSAPPNSEPTEHARVVDPRTDRVE